MVEGLDVAVEKKYAILRDADFLREYGPAVRVVELLESNLGNGTRTRNAFAELGIKVDGVGVEDSVREYLERLSKGDTAVRTHYGKMAIMCRVL